MRSIKLFVLMCLWVSKDLGAVEVT